jgi:hypothetical protein
MKNCPLPAARSLKKDSTTERTETIEKNTLALLCELCDLCGEIFFCD